MTKAVDDPIEIAAAHLARIDSGRVTQNERDAFDEWCKSAPENMWAWQCVSARWEDIPDENDADIREMLASTIARYPEASQSQASRRWLPIALAASLILAIGMPAALVLSGGGGSSQRTSAKPKIASLDTTRIASAPTKRRTIQLPDGSRVTLDAHSAIRIGFTDQQRSIWLEEGRAHFAVQKDKTRPFVVDAGRLSAIAVGTAFDVSRGDVGEEVVTTEGLVRVLTETPGVGGVHTTMVPAGMKLSQNVMGVHLASADLLTDSAWQSGKIIFSSECLAHVANKINRYGSQKLLISQDASSILISGVFDVDNASALAQSLKDQGLVDTMSSSNGIVLKRGPNARLGSCTF